MPIAPQTPSSPNQQPVLLESDVPLSQSVIWRLQREFYIQRGLRAWTEDMVPNFITNNPFIAEIYARIVFAFLCDCTAPRISPENPLRILELGAGVGKFSYLFLRHLMPLLRAKGIAPDAVRYCMTDCSESTIQAWRSNSYLADLVKAGVLEFELLQVGEEIKSQFLSRKGPLVLIASYVFDSLPQDAFVVQEGTILEALVTTAAPVAAGGESPQLSQLQFSYKNVSLPPHRYPEQSWNQILEGYRSRFTAATVLFPVAALKTLQELGRLNDGRMLVLAADKGYAHEDALALSQGSPALEFHTPNCFSQMVNFDAIGKYFASIRGEALMPEKHFASLNICALLQRRAGDQFPATKLAYQEAQAAFGPDDLFALLAWLNAHMEEIAIPQILAVLRLTRWDPIAFMRLFPVLARQLRTVLAERHDLRDAVLRVWANHYPVRSSENEIAFQCGVILLELRFFDDALSMFKTSQQIFGPSAATSYNLGLCCLGLEKSSEALKFMVEACNLDPAFEPARLSRHKLETKTI
ncbi:MAG TPA: SAM-dependent methyltransferase [Candidatus Angelobacter sp.]|nr:SAM-dependent methyltransferase [Candidatus Angelobacter sp.]